MNGKENPSVLRCNLSMATRLRKKPQLVQELSALLQSSPQFDVYMERLSDGEKNQRRVALYVDSTNAGDSNGQGTSVIECEWTGNGLEVVHYYVTKKRLHLGNNRHKQLRLSFDHRGLAPSDMTLQLYGVIQSLPIASERSEYVKKRISGWEAYLRVMERNADVEKLEIGIRSSRLSQDFRKVTFELQKLPNGFDKFYGKSAVRSSQTNQSLGKVVQVQMGKRTIDVELERDLQEKARTGKWKVPTGGKLSFDNVAEMAQINRLKEGFRRLENGWAVNPNLEKLLFEERPLIRKSKVPQGLEFKQNLNEYQRKAVEGAIGAQDLYVIQGPPGTGKTTVISEICYQNAKMGLKTLVASQSNLAVDNALGKLLTDQEIRILRIGRSESIEEEGQRFVEEQVALNWKEQTLASIQSHVNQFEKNGPALQAAIQENETKLDRLLKEKVSLEAKLKEQQDAQDELSVLKRDIQTRESAMEAAVVEKDSFEKELHTIRGQLEDAQGHFEQAKEQVDLFQGTSKFADMQSKVQGEIEELRNRLAYIDAELSLTDQRIERQVLFGTLKSVRAKQSTLQEAISEVASVKKLAELRELMGDESWTYSPDVRLLIRQMDKQQFDYVKLTQVSKGSPEINETLNKAISFATEKLTVQQNELELLEEKIKKAPLLDPTKITDAHAEKMLNAFRGLVKKRNGYRDPLDQVDRQMISSYYEHMLILKRSREASVSHLRTPESERLKKEILDTFERLKTAVIEAMGKRTEELNQEIVSLQVPLQKMDDEIGEAEVLLSQLGTKLSQKGHLETVAELKNRFAEKARLLEEMGTEQSYVGALVKTMNERKGIVLKHQQAVEQLEEGLSQLAQQRVDDIAYVQSLKDQMPALDALVAMDIKTGLNEITSTYDEAVLEQAELKRKETLLAVSNDIRLEWQDMLGQATAFDLDEIKKLYIQYANVIGVTCSISASKDFVTQYPDFDVVIIDEVSKATPPELLLPMLKGKKVVLVGDHHQLPPLVGQDTMDEVLEDMTDAKEKADLKAILKESIFERLFKDLPAESKTTLRIQYRMHEHIMETINPFYREKNYGLSCGLADSNKDRDHLLDGRYVKRGQHIVWYDMPHKQGYFEEREQDSRSFYNEAELTQIRELLKDLDQATATAKQQGRLDDNVKKKVGIISFYGEQVKKVNRMLSQELDLPNLHCRTGTVDKFQGMEMDVIILSFVRNHRQPDGNIGFLKDYRRLNVALSRARELLMIVGSVEMFTEKAKGESQKAMFQHVLKVVKQHNGLKQLETNVSRK